MLWRLLQVYWLVSILDLRCTAFNDTSTIKIKTKNNGKIDPFSFDVFPTSNGESFGKFSTDEENDPDMAIFFKDVDFFEDDSTFYQSPFDRSNVTMNDYFSKSLEDSRTRYMEDVKNIDKMFKTPVKSNIDDLKKGETTHDDTSSKNLNSSERTSVLNKNTESNVIPTTKTIVEISKSNSSNAQIPVTSDSENPSNAHTLCSDVHKAAGSSMVSKLVSMTEKDHKDVVTNAEEKDENRNSRGSSTNERLLGSQASESDNPILESMTVVTEISVQETVNGQIVQRKPSHEELRLIENKILGLSLQNASEQGDKKIKSKDHDYPEQNKESINIQYKNEEEENIPQEIINIPNEVIDDLSSFLKVDPNFTDDGMDRTIIDDEEIRDMDAILSEKDDEINNASRNEEINTNIVDVDSIKQNGQDDKDNDNIALEGDTKSESPTTNGNGGDPQDYRKIFHTEHKNLSNVSDVKIMFSETEGDFLDDDDDEYSLNVTEKPEMVVGDRTPKDINSFNGDKRNLNADIGNESILTTVNYPESTDLPIIKTGQIDKTIEVHSTIVSATKPTKETDNYDELDQYSTTTIANVDVTELSGQTTELYESIPESEINQRQYTTPNSDMKEKTVVSSQNINDTIIPEEPVTDLFEEFEDPIPDIPDISFTRINTSEEMDDIDRAMALIKKILSESASSEEKSPSILENGTQNLQNKDNSGIEETFTIPLDTSTMPIDSTGFTEAFTQTANNFNDLIITTEHFTGDSIGDQSSEATTNVGVGISKSTKDYTQNTLGSTESSFASTSLNNIVPDSNTKLDIVYATTKTNKPEYSSTEINDAVIIYKETVAEPHEISSSEVESMYNSKIEEYESLEDNNDDSREILDGWTNYGKKNKETIETVIKEKGQKERSHMVDKKTSSKNDADVSKESSTSIMDKEMLLVPVLRSFLLNNSAEFSVKITKEDETFYVPSSAHIQEYANTINITWKTNEYLNNSIALRISEKENFYVIGEIMINLLTGNEFIKQMRPVAFNPNQDLDDSISQENKIVMMKDGTYIFFSNFDFLKKNHEPLEYSEASMRERRLWHIEIAFICVTVIAIIVIILYVVGVKTKRKITLREKNELAQVTHC